MSSPRSLALLVAGLALLPPSIGLAQVPDVRVLDPPARLGDQGAARLLEAGLPGLKAIPTGSGELVLSGPRQVLDAAEELLRRLDRPPREVVVELHRGAGSDLATRERALGVGFGDRRPATTAREISSRSLSSGTRSLRLREGSASTLFVGEEIPYTTGGLLPQTRLIPAGRSLSLRLLRVDPGRGALLELAADTSSRGADGPLGPNLRRENLGTQVFAPFGQPTWLGGVDGGDQSTTRDSGIEGAFGVTESVDRRSGRPTGRFTRSPLDFGVRIGTTRVRESGASGYTVVVREVPAPEAGAGAGSARSRSRGAGSP